MRWRTFTVQSGSDFAPATFCAAAKFLLTCTPTFAGELSINRHLAERRAIYLELLRRQYLIAERKMSEFHKSQSWETRGSFLLDRCFRLITWETQARALHGSMPAPCAAEWNFLWMMKLVADRFYLIFACSRGRMLKLMAPCGFLCAISQSAVHLVCFFLQMQSDI